MNKQREVYQLINGKLEKINIEDIMPDSIIIRGREVERNDKDFEKKLNLYDGPLEALIGSDYDTVLHNRVKRIIDEDNLIYEQVCDLFSMEQVEQAEQNEYEYE